jgi:hypothetical protein
MNERATAPEYCKNNKAKIRAYQCEICDRLDVNDLSDKRFCTAGFWPGCGDPDGCREAFKQIEGKGRIGVHR